MHEKNQFVVIGRVVDTYGLKGELKVEPYLEKKHWKKIKRVFLKRKGGDYVAFELESKKPHGRHLVIRFLGCNSIEDAKRFVSAKIFLPASELPKTKKGEYYYFELEGMEVFTESGKLLGRITGIIDSTSYPLIEIDNGRGYIPFVSELVKEVKRDERKVIVSNLLASLYL